MSRTPCARTRPRPRRARGTSDDELGVEQRRRSAGRASTTSSVVLPELRGSWRHSSARRAGPREGCSCRVPTRQPPGDTRSASRTTPARRRRRRRRSRRSPRRSASCRRSPARPRRRGARARRRASASRRASAARSGSIERTPELPPAARLALDRTRRRDQRSNAAALRIGDVVELRAQRRVCSRRGSRIACATSTSVAQLRDRAAIDRRPRTAG